MSDRHDDKGRRGDQAMLKRRVQEIAQSRVRYGCRRIHVLLRREGWQVNAKRVNRIYREQGLQHRNKVPKRRVKAKLRDGCRVAVRANETWAMDFVHDQLATGRKLRVLTVVDTFTRYAPAIVPRFSFKAADVVVVLDDVYGKLGYPATTRVDRAASSCRANWIYGRICTVLSWTPRGLASRRTMPSKA